MDAQYQTTITPAVVGQNADLTITVDRRLRVEATIAEAVGSLTWAAPVAVAMTGSSKTFVPADATRKALKLWNPSANAAAAFDDAGGTVVLATSLPLTPGAGPVIYDGALTPTGIVTAIGTNTQNLYYQSGS